MNTKTGLSSDEAKRLLDEYGLNEINDINKVSVIQILIRQISKNFIIYLLIFSAILSFALGKSITGYVIFLVIFLVVGVGFIQEYKAEKSVSMLKKMLTAMSLVRRDGKDIQIESRMIVPGDLVTLRNGERIPTDCVVIESSLLKINESILTGESIEVVKEHIDDIKAATDKNMIYMGTFIVNGKCQAIVTHTGMNTKFGTIASMISTAEKELPLQDKINVISKYMVTVAITFSIATGLLMYFRTPTHDFESLTTILLLIVALSISAFPEGLPVVLVTTLAMGASRMAKQNAVVSRMSIIETLGETTVICSDKTGTITKGEMTVKEFYCNNTQFDVSGVGYESAGYISQSGQKININDNFTLSKLITTSVICNDSTISRDEESKPYKVMGTATEGALLVAGSKASVYKEDLADKRIEELPFDSSRKMMSVFIQEKEQIVGYMKGAPEQVLQKCTHILINHEIKPMTEVETNKILEKYSQMADLAMRALGFAYKNVSPSGQYREEGFTFIGLAAMEDPPRPEVREAIATAKRAGIDVKMITGDNRKTAESIASAVGLSGKVLEGQNLDKMSDEELFAIVKEVSIFARVQPAHKLRIVRALKKHNEIVTMTGDGVNDAPALKEAHIGVAMGMNGTDVSRSVADITLKDDNFATIVYAIKEGRGIFTNIQKFVTYELSTNIAELAILFFGMLLQPVLGWQVPVLVAIQILFMNLVTDNLPAITLAFNPISGDTMKRKPLRNSSILNKYYIALLLCTGAFMAVMVLGVYYYLSVVAGENPAIARSAALVTLIFLEIANAFSFRSFRLPVIGRGLFVNKYLPLASVISIFATVLIIYTPLNLAFETVPLELWHWALALVVALIGILVFDILKVFKVIHVSH
ncbi:MAG: cation-transporting P-type ATPase [bacterium]|nr:cation-transporting P-type ATPase [bacterium]